MATQKAFKEELNPFEIAKQQFNRAADYLELDAVDAARFGECQTAVDCFDSGEDGWRRRAGV